MLAWTDQVAVQAMSQATESQQPAYDSTGLNGFGALLFDSSASQWLGVDSKLFSGTSGAIIAVVEEVGGGSANSTIIGQGRNNQDNWMSFESEGGTANTPALDSDDGTQNGDVSYTANTACVLVVRSDGSLYKFWRDGTAGSTIGNGNWWDDAASNANQTTIGARRRNGTTDRFFEGYIAEILVYSSITDANILRAINALRSTYGI